MFGAGGIDEIVVAFIMALLSPLRNRQREPSGSRRATPALLLQHRSDTPGNEIRETVMAYKVDTVQSMIDGWGFNLITDPGSVILRNGTVKR